MAKITFDTIDAASLAAKVGINQASNARIRDSQNMINELERPLDVNLE